MRLQSASGWLIATVLLCVSSGNTPSLAQITRTWAAGHIKYYSGFPPFNAAPGFVTNIPGGQPFNVIPVGGSMFLQRWHGSFNGDPTLSGYAQGGTALQIIEPNPFSYFFHVPASTYLYQRRVSCGGASPLPLKLAIHWDCYFTLGAAGLPAHFDTFQYPVVGRNTTGAGSYSGFKATFHYAMTNLDGTGTVDLGTVTYSYVNGIPGAMFAVPLRGFKFVPAIPPNKRFVIWGDVEFVTRGCPGLLEAAADDISSVGGEAAPPPAQDPSITLAVADPSIFMEMPFDDLTDPGNQAQLEVEDIDENGNLRHPPVLAPIARQVGNAGSPLSFNAVATDPDGHALTYSLENPPPGASIDSNGHVSWTPPAAGMNSLTVRARKTAFPNLYDEQQVSVTVNGTNTAPTLASIPDQQVTVNSTLNLTAVASDPDAGQTKTFSLVAPVPEGASITSGGMLTYKPPSNVAPRAIKIRVTDNGTPPLSDDGQVLVRVNPGSSPFLELGAGSALSWASPYATSYDVVQGNLATLRSSGSFTLSVEACLANDLAASTVTDPTLPSVGSPRWYLVREVVGTTPGSYETGSAHQRGGRDAEIGVSGNRCP